MTTPMTDGRRADSARRRERVLKALDAMLRGGGDITVSGLARAARVDRAFLYRHRDLLERVHAAASTPPEEDRIAAVSRASLQADLANALERNKRLASRVRQLEKRLSQTLGEAAWTESGLGAPADIDQLQRRITMLEQELADTRGQLEERSDDLDAARAANRELTRALNQGR
jgi:chromosome segregation ATPase